MAPVPALCPKCLVPGGHHRMCPEWPAWDGRKRATVERVNEIREAKATGHRRFRGAAQAVRWYMSTRSAWASPKGLPLDPDRDGDGSPNRGADDPKRAAFAAVAYAIKVAQDDDRERHPARPAPLFRWLGEHFGVGRAYVWIAESTGWSEGEVSGRIERALRIVRDRLRERGWMDA